MHHPVANFLQSICAKHHENLLRADKVISVKAVCSFFGPLATYGASRGHLCPYDMSLRKSCYYVGLTRKSGPIFLRLWTKVHQIQQAFAGVGYPIPTVKFLGDNALQLQRYERSKKGAFEWLVTPVVFSPFVGQSSLNWCNGIVSTEIMHRVH